MSDEVLIAVSVALNLLLGVVAASAMAYAQERWHTSKKSADEAAEWRRMYETVSKKLAGSDSELERRKKQIQGIRDLLKDEPTFTWWTMP